MDMKLLEECTDEKLSPVHLQCYGLMFCHFVLREQRRWVQLPVSGRVVDQGDKTPT